MELYVFILLLPIFYTPCNSATPPPLPPGPPPPPPASAPQDEALPDSDLPIPPPETSYNEHLAGYQVLVS